MTGITTALAVSAGRGSGAVWVALAALAGQLSVGWSNDYLDRDRDRAAGRGDKPLATGELAPQVVRVAISTALVLVVPLSLLSGWRAALAHLLAVGAAWAYNLRLKATVLSFLPYGVAFALLPAFVTLGLPGHPTPPWWACTAGALLGTGAHFVNTLPDLESDERTGVRGLPHRLGRRISTVLGGLLLGGAGLLLALVDGLSASSVVASAVALVLVAGVVVAGLSRHVRLAWPLTLLTAATAVGLLLARGARLA